MTAMKTKFYTHSLLLIILCMSCLPSCKQDAGKSQRGLNERTVDMTQFTRTELDIPYANTDNMRQTLDITYPVTGMAPYKMIVLFHGGGWTVGNKRSAAIAAVFQATTQGYAVVSVNYRLSGEVTWPVPLHDAKAAIRFLRAHADAYQLDAEKIVAWGASAGGHIAEMLAATNNQPAFEDVSMGNKNFSSAVQGVVAWYAVSAMNTLSDRVAFMANAILGYDVRENRDKVRDASPIELVTGAFPPILLVHGTNDRMVPYRQSVEMRETINKATGKETASLIIIKGAYHGDPVIMTMKRVAEYLDFVDTILFGGKNPFRNTRYRDIRILD